MKDEQIVELQELEKLETEGSLGDGDAYKLGYLRDLQARDKVAADVKKNLETALAQKDHFRQKYEKEAKDKEELAAKLKLPIEKTALDVSDYIDISASLEGLDQREKEYLAEQHKLTGKPLAEIRKDENFQLWDTAYKQKVEKEKVLPPSNTQPETTVVTSFENKLEGATLAEKEKILIEAGLYKEVRPRADRQSIGPK